MLRNLGKVVLNNHHGAVTFPGELTEPDVTAWEQKIYGVTASEVTAVLLDHWRFTVDTIGAVRGHRDPATTPESIASAARLHLACAVVAEWGNQLPGETHGWRTDAARCAEAGVCEADFLLAAGEAREQFARLAQLDVSCAA
jgi:HD-like signal output (HDOD) protein